ncbi:MAG: PKD domain-containing protein, partial [Deltaproteobacteria bacterium]|nr:PKD domain-containing protein [Deltaproteobacteria bacterium]
YGCNDCHGGSAGVFNGSFSLLGTARRISDGVEEPLTISWNDAGDVQATALAWNEQGNLFTIDFSSGTQTRDPERWEFLGYDAGRVAALNVVTPAAFGLGVAPVAEIATINGIAASIPLINFEVGTTADLVATDAGAVGSFQYRWNVNDEPGMLSGQTVSKTFFHTGLWNVMLTVIDEEGRLTQDVQQVNVTNPDPSTAVQVVATAGSPGVTLSLSNLPTHDQIKFYFGDGTRQYVSDGGATFDLSRNYRLRDTYLKDTDTNGILDSYIYKTSIQIKNAGVMVEVINIYVVIPQ